MSRAAWHQIPIARIVGKSFWKEKDFELHRTISQEVSAAAAIN